MTKQQEQIYALHRYFIWQNKMRDHFDENLSLSAKSEGKEKRMEIETFLYMSYWYGGLYVLIEGWKHLKLKDPRIDKLLESSNVDLLKRYRNATFHYQDEYWSKKFTAFMNDGEQCVHWIRKLNREFGRFLLREIDTINRQLDE